MSEDDTDRAQVATLSTSARAYLVTLETMRRIVEETTAERDALAAGLRSIAAHDCVTCDHLSTAQCAAALGAGASAALEALGAGARARRPRGPAAAPVRPGRPPRARAGGPRGGERQVRFSL